MNKKTIILVLIFLGIFFSDCSRNNKIIDNSFKQNNKETKNTDIKITNTLKPGNYKFKIMQKNKERYYLLHIPRGYHGDPTSLILSFHGGMGNAEIQQEYYGWVEKSDKEGFIVAFPNGASRLKNKFATWNAGRCCGYAVESGSDDVGFIKLIINDIKNKVNVNKIFAAGMSNGGMLSHRIACEMSDVFDAVAAVAGTNVFDACNPQEPISVMHIHGLQDDHVLFEGGCGPKCVAGAETEFTSVPKTISDWIGKNNCNQNPKRVFDVDNGYCDLYSSCDNNVQIKLCVAKDGGHSWPGASEKPTNLEKTKPSQAFDATDEIWNFFKTQ